MESEEEHRPPGHCENNLEGADLHMTTDEYNYLKALWSRFYGYTMMDSGCDTLRRSLGGQLSKSQRKQLLRLVDALTVHTEQVSLESFVAGFRLAAGIARELEGERYSFDQEEEEQIRKVSSHRSLAR